VNQIPQATLPNIQATGARGFLQWLAADQPGLYMRVLPVLKAQVPQLWSDQVQSDVVTNLGRLFALGQDDESDDSTEYIQPVSPDFIEPVSLDISAADEADTGSLDPSTASSVSGIIGNALSSVSNSSLANTIATVVGGQLQNASAGLPPSAASTSALGQAFSSITSSSTALWLIGGGVALVLIALAASG
jgi:hypothetical protein